MPELGGVELEKWREGGKHHDRCRAVERDERHGRRRGPDVAAPGRADRSDGGDAADGEAGREQQRLVTVEPEQAPHGVGDAEAGEHQQHDRHDRDPTETGDVVKAEFQAEQHDTEAQ